MNWSALISKAFRPLGNRGRLVLWCCLLTFIFGTTNVGQPAEDFLRDWRARLNQRPVSGDIVLVAIDDKSIAEVGRFPWPRERHAELASAIADLEARRIYFDVVFDTKSSAESDAALADTLARLGRKVVVPAVATENEITGARTEAVPLPEFRSHTDLVHITAEYGWFGTVRKIPGAEPFEGKMVPSLASKIAGDVPSSGDLPIDFSMTPESVPVFSAVDVIKGRVDRESIRGKSVVIGVTYTPWIDAYVAPIYNRIPGVYFHILAAETLAEGPPRIISWLFPFLGVVLLVVACAAIRWRAVSIILIPVGGATLLFMAMLLEQDLVYLEIVPALVLLLAVGSAFSITALRQLYRDRGTTNAVSGLPNLAALQQRTGAAVLTLVAARVHNYAAIASTLPPEAERLLVEQIAKRLTVASVEPTLYQGDEGIFAWFTEREASDSTGAHLDALHRLFRSPVTVDGRQFDLRITFGFDIEADRSLANRLGSALVAVDEADAEGRKWKEYDPSRLKDADWKLSLLSQLDNAIDSGDLWVAYQPKLDLRTSTIVGAEALARWTHPEKGSISPMEFIIAAEENDRIEKLTYFVLDQSIRTAAEVNRCGHPFGISVNLSARLIEDTELVAMVTGILAKHGLAPSLLTLEVTETAAIDTNLRHLTILQELRDLGIEISVDDYGTGMSTLDYLQRIPATEIKIDRSFVAGMRSNQGTKVMVNSTIQLAHSLGQKVVAEGVEDAETLDELKSMNCDLAQGYLIGRPMMFRALSKRLKLGRHEGAA